MKSIVWPYQGFPSLYLDPALTGGQKGHVLVQLQAGDAKRHRRRSRRGHVQQQDHRRGGLGRQDRLEMGRPGARRRGPPAPRLRRLPNGNTLVLVNVLHPVTGFTQPQVLDDAIYEVTPKGEIVWRWLASDHLDEFGFTPDQLKLVRASRSPDYLHSTT